MTDYRFAAVQEWKNHFIKSCAAPIADRLCADTAGIRYFETIELEKKIKTNTEADMKLADDKLDDLLGARELVMKRTWMLLKSIRESNLSSLVAYYF